MYKIVPVLLNFSKILLFVKKARIVFLFDKSIKTEPVRGMIFIGGKFDS